MRIGAVALEIKYTKYGIVSGLMVPYFLLMFLSAASPMHREWRN